MDDGSLFGNICDVLKAWDIIKLSGPELGLFVNAPKCELILPSGNLDCFTIEADIKRIQGCNMDILRSPVGSKAHCEDWVALKLLKRSLLYLMVSTALIICNLLFSCFFSVQASAKSCGIFELFLQIPSLMLVTSLMCL